jgi:hypothetical protein
MYTDASHDPTRGCVSGPFQHMSHARIIQLALYSIRRLQHGIISPASDAADTYYYYIYYNTQKEITPKDSQGPAPIISFVCVCIILI